jgi:anti-anti-sigma factor
MSANPFVSLPELRLEMDQTASKAIFHCVGRITSSSAPLLKSSVRSMISEKKAIVLNLSNVTHVDSSGLGALVSLWVSAQREGCEVILISLNERVRQLLHLTSLDRVLLPSRLPNTPIV